jgi:hypothetical protein
VLAQAMARAAIVAAVVVCATAPRASNPGALADPVSSAHQAANCARTSAGLTPLSDLGRNSYQGEIGGLYPQASNSPPGPYLRKGLARAHRVRPLDSRGRSARGGRIVLLSIGMSNASEEFSAFKQLADADSSKNPRVKIVDGAQGGYDAERVVTASAPFLATVDQRLHAAGVTAAQVEAVWLKEAIAGEREPFPQDARRLARDLDAIIRILRRRFDRLALVYLASRTYAGYATSPLNPEPYAYQSGFAVRRTIEDRIAGRLRGPWVGWGPYLWTDGTRGRSDGLVWTCADVGPDGTHPSPNGSSKVAALLLRFFSADATARRWFLAGG